MKNSFKKWFSVFFVFSVICAGIFASPIKIKNGYKDLNWGTTVKDAQKKGYKLSLLSGEEAKMFQNQFSEKVDVYYVKATEKNILKSSLNISLFIKPPKLYLCFFIINI